MAVNLTRPVGTVISDNSPTAKGDHRTLFNDVILAVNGLDPLLTPSYASRAAAVAGAPALAAAVTQIFVREGTALVIRSRTAFADDPLFEEGSRWGVTLRQDLGSVASLATPVLVSVAGTANAITASLPASAISAGLTGSSVGVVEFVPASTNTTITPTLMIAGDTTTRSIVRMDGTTLAIGDIQAGRAMRLMRFGAQFRVLSRLPSEEQLSINAALQTTIAVDAASSAALRSLDAAGFVTFPLQVSFAAGTTLSGLPAGALMVVPASGSRFWTALEGGVLVQNYHEGSNGWRRERSGNAWLSWQVISLVVVGSNLSAANRNFNGALLLTPGVTYVMDGSGAILNGPDGTQSYVGRSETDRVSGQVRQRIWLNGDVSPLTRIGGVSGSWVRSAPGLDGAMIVFPGDSETFGVGTANAATDAFPVVAARKLGCAYLKLGTAGAQMDSTTAATQAQKDGSFVETVNANIATIAIAARVVVAFGTNDFNRSTLIGAISNTVRGTFYGAMREGVAAIIEANPATKIVFITPTYRAISGSNPAENFAANSAGHTLEAYRDAIRVFAKRFGYQVIEGRDGVGINELNVATLAPDGLHPSTPGARLLGEHIARQIS